ncbi:MAG TPA: HAMP domain-containing sensor histidine kinase [Anaerolineae bacterium]|nr:HAMP domain-containing sensor histidine kinase [Anaerolineae bacterium]HQI86561.1 HAMP domain-containing sensor histidine kinase [Anaerolineae bacterium]
MGLISRFINVPSADPDDARRRKLLSFLLSILGGLLILTLIYILYVDMTGAEDPEPIKSLFFASTAVLGGIVLLFIINRYGPGWLASLLFVLLLTFAIVFTSEPRLLLGEYMFYLTIPIVMASMLVRPWASYVIASLNTLFLALAARQTQVVLPLPGVLGFYLLALVSWLTTQTMERALHDLRDLNIQLERRVQERTIALASANQELIMANERLEELDKLKSRFLSIVSHELRTPLSAIQGFAEMLQNEVYGALSPKQHNALNRIIANDERLLNLVNDLLDQARIEAGQLSLVNAPFPLQGLISDMESTMRVLVEAKKLYLRIHVADAVPTTLYGDQKRLQQILVNLVNNALKFTQQGGVDIHFYRPDEAHWAIDVVDTGPGIPKEAQGFIFDPFRQIDSSSTREHKGFGLGLAIVKQLTTLMGGTVTVISEVGQGSTFTVILPLIAPQREK